MKKIHQNYLINASSEKVWQALTDPEIISKWSGQKSVMNDKVGSKFNLWGGSITGTNIAVLTGKKLVQSWRSDDWAEGHFSKVTFNLIKEDEGTKIILVQTNVPDEHYDDISAGWEEYYLGNIKKFLEVR